MAGIAEHRRRSWSGTLAQTLAKVLTKRPHINVFDRYPREARAVVAAAALGLTQPAPVGRSIARPAETLALNKCLGQVDRVTIFELPISGEHRQRSA